MHTKLYTLVPNQENTTSYPPGNMKSGDVLSPDPQRNKPQQDQHLRLATLTTVRGLKLPNLLLCYTAMRKLYT